ncbi:hypothetical protein Zmor_023772 [Zophobas morio]|uniref:Uncharacterized protein n=1 Tax=Zophobas morio TaxID=2755281 RepID=A0AA38HZ50_9CUCU|nr:hypothetical protein Zmor_023772 [Zophobas morio]
MQFKKDMKFFKGRLKFLTIWNMILQAVFFTICVINDVIGTNEDAPKKTPFIRRIKDLILTCLAFPLSMFVGLTFWCIYFVDRELIFPRALDKFFPVWLNHAMHTNIMIFILIELYTSYRKYPSRKFGMSVLSVFMLIYLIWIHIIHAYSGAWRVSLGDLSPVEYPRLTFQPQSRQLIFYNYLNNDGIFMIHTFKVFCMPNSFLLAVVVLSHHHPDEILAVESFTSCPKLRKYGVNRVVSCRVVRNAQATLERAKTRENFEKQSITININANPALDLGSGTMMPVTRIPRVFIVPWFLGKKFGTNVVLVSFRT